jgi:S-adenosylmethionine:tRNA ribosyltransferase-isomerase
MRLDDFDYPLPEHLIATRPVEPRTAARLLVAEGGGIRDLHVADLPDVLRPGDRLVVNDTRVIPARLTGLRRRITRDGSGEARVEVTLMSVEPGDGAVWRVLAKPLRRLAAGDVIDFGALTAEVVARQVEDAVLRFDRAGPALEAALVQVGQMPLPPYIAARRAPDAQDKADYQTVFAARPGAVAAPTASLHFDAALLAALRARGVELTRITLHVGAGTFLPVKVDDIARHRMHAEWAEVTEAAAAQIAATRAAGGRIIAVGTTALRTLETAAQGGAVEPFAGETDIFIRPGHLFRGADGLMTNFHLPKSTLMMLVAALMGLDRIRAIYAHAIAQGYRFFSYGDASLLIPPPRRS